MFWLRFKFFVSIILALIFIFTMSFGVSATAVGESVEGPTVIQGDFNESGSVTASDAVYLLYYTLFGGVEYSLNSFADVNGDGYIDSDDASYLLYNALYGDEEYPLYKVGESDGYTVTFADYNGRILKTESVEYGKSATAPSSPCRKGYNFIGWDCAFNEVLGDTTSTALYETANNQVYIDYVDNGNGTVTAVFSINGNVDIAVLELQLEFELNNATYSNYCILSNGLADANCVDNVFYFSLMSIDDITEPCELFSITFDNISENVSVVFDVIDSVVSNSTFTDITEANVVGTVYNR